MSRTMQLRVKIEPYYEKSFAKSFPKIATAIARLESGRVDENPSLYQLAGQVDKLLYRFEGTALREALLPFRDDLESLHRQIEDKIASWHLSEADTLMYKLEDIFETVEDKLA